MLADGGVKAIFFPVRPRTRPIPVEPQPSDLSILRAEDFHGSIQVIEIFGEALVAAMLAVPAPVERCVIKERHDALRPAALDKLRHQISPCGGTGSVERTEPPCVVERESIVVPSGQAGIAHPGIPAEAGHRTGIKFLDSEPLRQALILLNGDFFEILNPLPFSQQGVETEMEEEAEAELLEARDARKRLWDGEIVFHGLTFELRCGSR